MVDQSSLIESGWRQLASPAFVFPLALADYYLLLINYLTLPKTTVAERESNSVTSGYKHLAPLGAKSDSINSWHFQIEFAFLQ